MNGRFVKALVVVRTGLNCTLCPPVTFVAAKIARQQELPLFHELQTEKDFIHAIPVVSLGTQILYAPTPAQLSVNETTLIAAVLAAQKYSMHESEDDDTGTDDSLNEI